jgi:phospholipid-binding lipoprotein MlaA
MKNRAFTLLPLLAGLFLISGNSSAAILGAAANGSLGATGGNKTETKASKAVNDDLDEYSNVASVPDPIQPVNRGTFWVNHQLYRYILKPISKTYDKVVPLPVRQGIYNVFDNLEYPDRVVNDLLQWKLKRAGYETEKFLLNSTVGVAGLMKVSNHFPTLAALPRPDTGLTFAKWGCDHGCYIVLPVFGPKSARDTVGFAGDVALSPLFWFSLWFPSAAWMPAVSTPDSLRGLHDKLSAYDAATENTLDRYLSARSAYIQYRKQAELKQSSLK